MLMVMIWMRTCRLEICTLRYDFIGSLNVLECEKIKADVTIYAREAKEMSQERP